MSRHMKTTVRLDNGLLEQVKREAARRHQILTSLIEEGLRLLLAGSRPQPQAPVVLPVSSARGGTLRGIDLDDSAAVLNILEVRR